jgi:hypothetical protein
LIGLSKKCLVGPRMAIDVVNPRMLELETAKEILAEQSLSRLLGLRKSNERTLIKNFRALI